MKIIIIGTGFIARTHITAIRALGHEVAWIVGRNESRTKDFAEEIGINNWTTDLDTALKSDASVVHICTPPMNHASLIHKCLDAGKHIICEKPLCIDPKEAAVLAAKAEELKRKRGIVTALCCNVRYYPANIKAAEIIRGSDHGDPKIFMGSYLQEYHIPPHEDGWRFDSKASGGQRAISEIGTHWIDLAYAWTGLRITSVYAVLNTWYPYRYKKDGMLTLDGNGEKVFIDTEDTASVLLRFENGGTGTLLLSETSPGHPNDLSLEVTDLHTSYKWEESDTDKFWYSSEGSMHCDHLRQIKRDDTFTELFRSVYSAAEGNDNSDYPTFMDGLYISAVCDAIKRSGTTGEWASVEF